MSPDHCDALLSEFETNFGIHVNETFFPRIEMRNSWPGVRRPCDDATSQTLWKHQLKLYAARIGELVGEEHLRLTLNRLIRHIIFHSATCGKIQVEVVCLTLFRQCEKCVFGSIFPSELIFQCGGVWKVWSIFLFWYLLQGERKLLIPLVYSQFSI